MERGGETWAALALQIEGRLLHTGVEPLMGCGRGKHRTRHEWNRADLELAVAVRQPGQVNQASPGQRGLSPDARMRLARLMHSPPRRTATVGLPVSGLRARRTWPEPQRASWRVVPVGKVIRIRDDDVRRELLVLAYVQSADGARFTTAGWPFRPFTPFTAADDRGAAGTCVCSGPAGRR